MKTERKITHIRQEHLRRVEDYDWRAHILSVIITGIIISAIGFAINLLMVTG